MKKMQMEALEEDISVLGDFFQSYEQEDHAAFAVVSAGQECAMTFHGDVDPGMAAIASGVSLMLAECSEDREAVLDNGREFCRLLMEELEMRTHPDFQEEDEDGDQGE